MAMVNVLDKECILQGKPYKPTAAAAAYNDESDYIQVRNHMLCFLHPVPN